MTNPLLVEVTRGAFVESRHTGAIVVADADGKRVIAIGEVEAPVFPRSAVKALQALPLVESGAADRYGFGNAELALASASHSGEPRHVETAANMLAAAGRSAADLECGVHMPFSSVAERALIRTGHSASPLHNNCSGKHAGFICLACHRGKDPRGYVEPDHPVQREITAVLASMTGARLDDEPAIDGCSIPAWSFPLDALARAFARFATGDGLPSLRAAAAKRIMAACMAEPFMVAGSGRFCTDTMSLFPGRIFVKSGAEGVFCGAVPESGLGFALKIDDGAGRATEVTAAAIVATLVPHAPEALGSFADRLVQPIVSRRGAKVGEVRPTPELLATLRQATRRS
jgi:L-asparaginase II